jgi:NAD-dependent deacetylase
VGGVNDELDPILSVFRRRGGRAVFLTGAGVSAESGIPTFRGKDGFWTIGSRNYTPMQMATRRMFEDQPEEVWAWYLARFAACSAAQPNAAHLAIARLEAALGDRLALVTQNIDGLHQRAGSTEARTFAIHGDARQVRCAAECDGLVHPFPALAMAGIRAPLPPEVRALTCGACGGWLRPHVLWFDEFYNERYYRSESAMKAALGASLLVVVGTTGATSLPAAIGETLASRGVAIVDVNPEENFFSGLAAARGAVLREPAVLAVPRLAAALAASA